MELLHFSQIRTDGGTQPRAQLDLAIIAEYAEQMADGIAFPPITVFYDGADYWLADGFHRINAAQQVGMDEIATDVRQGTIQDAQWYSYSVNQAHGLRRSNEDKRRAVEAALKHPYAATKSTRDIAGHCGVSHTFVNNMRGDVSVNRLQIDTRLVTRNGQMFEMNTANIGRNGNGHPAAVVDYDDAELADFSMDEWESDEEEEEAELRFDPTQHMAYCKYCYTIHGDWTLSGDHSPSAWICERCDHATRDDFMQIAEEDEPEEIDYADPGMDSNEWYTPVEFIEAARRVMDGIDTDPASNDTAQAFIQAGEYYTKETNGLAQKWGERVWLNPPYAEPLPWIEKLLAEFEAGHTKQAILLVNTANSPQWSRLLWHSLFTVCMLDRRVRFWRPDRIEAKGTAQDQMIWYVGYDTDTFREVFEAFGAIR